MEETIFVGATRDPFSCLRTLIRTERAEKGLTLLERCDVVPGIV